MKLINKLFFVFFLISLSICQFDWQDNGLPIRQGYHIEWQRTADIGNNGDVIFAWSDTRDGGRDIYAKKIDSQGNELWNSDGQIVVKAPGRQEDPQLVNDGNGGAYIIWKDYRDEPDDGDFYAQHILADGSLAWNELGVSLTSVSGKQTSPNLCVDGQGGAFAIWKDESGSGVPPVYGTHLGPNENDIINPGVGVELISSDLNFGGVSLEVAAPGSAILVWSFTNNNNEHDLYAQRLDTDCNLLWPTLNNPSYDGILLSEESGNQSYPRVTYYNETVSVIVWEDDRAGDDDIYAQFINMDGSLVFNEDLIVCSALDRQYKPRVKADANGAFVVWSDRRDSDFIDDNNHIYMQKINPEEGLEWSEEIEIGVDSQSVSFGVDHKAARLSTDGNGGAYIAWESNLNDDKYDIRFQQVNANGILEYDVNGLEITNGKKTQEAPVVRPDLDQGAFVIWGDYRTGSPGVYVQHIENSGQISLEQDGREMYWGIDGNTVSTYATKPTSCYLGNNRGIIGWSDQRFGAGEVINFGQKIYNNWENSEQVDGYKLSNYLSYNENGEVSGGHDSPLISQLDGNIIHFFSTSLAIGPSLRYQLLDQNLNILGDDQGKLVNNTEYPQFWDTFDYVNATDGFGYLVFSEQINNFAYNVLLQKFDSDGNAIFSNPINLTSDGIGDKNVKALHEIEGLGFVAIYQSESWLTGLSVELAIFDYQGNILPGSNISVDNSGEKQIYQGSVLTDSGVFITYLRETSGTVDSDIYGQMVSVNGEISGDLSGISLVSKEGKQENATTTYNDLLSEIFICYEDGNSAQECSDFQGIPCEGTLENCTYTNPDDCTEDGNCECPLKTISWADILCVSISSSLILGDELIVGDLYSVNQVEPYVYSTLDGSYLVVWQDDRNYTDNLAGNEDIYLQQITNGSLIYSENGIAVCNESYFPQKNPQIELYDESNNSYVIYWNDLRSSGKANFTNIYAQSITVNSGPLCTLGDINQDTIINVIDIVSLVNYILGASDFNSAQLCAADLNGDSIINVIDIVSLVNQILSL